MRDAKLGEIGEGTSEVQRTVIARALLAGRARVARKPTMRATRPAHDLGLA